MLDPAIPKTLLLVDDDKPFLTRLGRAMETRGFAVRMADTVAQGIAEVKREAPYYAVVDLRLTDGNGLDVIEALHGSRPEARVVGADRLW
jgi:two-component system response regulator RegA